MPEAGFEPTRRCRRTLAKGVRLPVPPFGHVRENGEAEKTRLQVTPRSHGATIAFRVTKVIIRLLQRAAILFCLGDLSSREDGTAATPNQTLQQTGDEVKLALLALISITRS